MNLNDFISCEKARGDSFRLLAACFYQPEKEVFIQERIFEELASLLRQVSPEASVFVSEMEKSFSRYSEQELSVDYAKLFVGPHDVLAPPFGSVYLDGGRRVMGDSTMEVMKLYEEAGLVMDREFKNLPDHITAELEFIYYLVFRETEALEKSDLSGVYEFIGKQKLFWERFLSKWIPLFCDRMRGGAKSDFYRALADCACAFIRDATPGEALPTEPSQ